MNFKGASKELIRSQAKTVVENVKGLPDDKAIDFVEMLLSQILSAKGGR